MANINRNSIGSQIASSEERMAALADVLAEGFMYLAEHDLLSEFQDSMSPESGSNTT